MSVNVTDVSGLNVSHIYTLWYWNCSCVVLYLSDSTPSFVDNIFLFC